MLQGPRVPLIGALDTAGDEVEVSIAPEELVERV
jgi:hypothetical protein